MKHALVVRKKCCRAMTGSTWKQLRAGMERKLAERLAAQQRFLDEELAFVQVGLMLVWVVAGVVVRASLQGLQTAASDCQLTFATSSSFEHHHATNGTEQAAARPAAAPAGAGLCRRHPAQHGRGDHQLRGGRGGAGPAAVRARAPGGAAGDQRRPAAARGRGGGGGGAAAGGCFGAHACVCVCLVLQRCTAGLYCNACCQSPPAQLLSNTHNFNPKPTNQQTIKRTNNTTHTQQTRNRRSAPSSPQSASPPSRRSSASPPSPTPPPPRAASPPPTASSTPASASTSSPACSPGGSRRARRAGGCCASAWG